MTNIEALKDTTNLKRSDSNAHDQASKTSHDGAPVNEELKNENVKETTDKKVSLLDLEIMKNRLTEAESKLMEKTVQLHVILRVLDKYRKKCSVTDKKLKKIIETAVGETAAISTLAEE